MISLIVEGQAIYLTFLIHSKILKLQLWVTNTKSLLVFKVSRKFLRLYIWAIYRRRSKSPPANQAIKKGHQKVYEHHDASLAKAQKIIPNLVVQNLTKQPMSKSFQSWVESTNRWGLLPCYKFHLPSCVKWDTVD